MTPAVIIVPMPPACALRHDCSPAQIHDLHNELIFLGWAVPVIVALIALWWLVGSLDRRRMRRRK